VKERLGAIFKKKMRNRETEGDFTDHEAWFVALLQLLEGWDQLPEWVRTAQRQEELRAWAARFMGRKACERQDLLPVQQCLQRERQAAASALRSGTSSVFLERAELERLLPVTGTETKSRGSRKNSGASQQPGDSEIAWKVELLLNGEEPELNPFEIEDSVRAKVMKKPNQATSDFPIPDALALATSFSPNKNLRIYIYCL
jgi:hypothetical protein